LDIHWGLRLPGVALMELRVTLKGPGASLTRFHAYTRQTHRSEDSSPPWCPPSSLKWSQRRGRETACAPELASS